LPTGAHKVEILGQLPFFFTQLFFQIVILSLILVQVVDYGLCARQNKGFL